jgi:acyl-coenzyme A thioesterase PaaI-like protein
MQLTNIPFAQLIRLKHSQSGYVFELLAHDEYTNHLGTVAAAAQFSLAEFASGQCLLDTFPDLQQSIIPMLRKSDVKFRKPAFGRIRAKATLDEKIVEQIRNELSVRNRTICHIRVDVVNDDEEIVMSGNYEWFLQRKSMNVSS